MAVNPPTDQPDITGDPGTQGKPKATPGPAPSDAQAQARKATPPQQQAQPTPETPADRHGPPGKEQQQKPQQGSEQGIGPAWQALVSGLGDLSKDPEWMQHPLLRLLSDPTADPEQMGQDLYSASQWWGRVLNAAFDPNAIHAAAVNISHDKSVGGQIAQHVFDIHDDPVSNFMWDIIPNILAIGAEWMPWEWVPVLTAQGPSQMNQVPGALMSLFGSDLKHPQFEDPNWYARMGSYVISSAVIAKSGGRAAGPLLKFSGRLKLFESLSTHADRVLGGPSSKTAIKGPDGQMYDPEADPTGHAFAQWWHDNLEPVQETATEIGKAAPKVSKQLIQHPEIPGAYQEVSNIDLRARSELAQKLGLVETSTAEEVRNKLSMLAEERDLSPQLSAQILKHWDRYGPAIGMTGRIQYWHAGEDVYRNALETLKQVPEGETKEAASQAMRAANGLRADLKAGVHSYGNELVEALTKGVLNHSRSSGYYGVRMIQAIEKVLTTPEARERVTRAIESPVVHDNDRSRLEQLARNPGDRWYDSMKAQEELDRRGPAEQRYDGLSPEEKWAVDFTRRMIAEARAHKQMVGKQIEAQPNFVYSVPKKVRNLDKILAGIPEDIRMEVRRARGRTPFAYVRQEHRAVQLVGTEEGELRAETAYATRQDANAARAQWRAAMKADLLARAAKNPKLQAVVNDERKFNALLHAELPDFSTDIVDILRDGLLRDIKATHTYEIMEAAKNTLIEDPKDGRMHPLAVARSEGGQEASPTLDPHFKELHGASTTTDFYSGLGYKTIQGLASGNYIFHPRFADALNTAMEFAKGDPDSAFRHLNKLTNTGKRLIMLNPAWHSTNMIGRFAWLTAMHPRGVANALLRAKGMAKDLPPEEAQKWWDSQEHEAIDHGLLPPQLNSDVVADVGRYHLQGTGDIEIGTPLDGKQPLKGFSNAAASTVDAVKGVNEWWQNHVNAHMWNQIHNFSVLAYIVLKDDALSRGMSAGDSRIMAASQANAWAGMVSPDRWMYSPSMYRFSHLVAFAPNWWRTFPRLILNSYDRMGMASNPALTHAWALNTVKAIAAMVMLKAATDNILNYLMSGHWQFQNPQGYQNQITMDRFYSPDPKTGAHHVMENPFERQVTDLEKATGLYQAMNDGQWRPEYAEQGATEVAAARVSPAVQALETATNLDVYATIKNRALRFVDPKHPYPFGSAEAMLAGLGEFTPVGFTAQAGLAGSTAQPGTLDWGPFKGTQIPGWAMRAFDPNDPLVPILSLLGVRGGYPSPVKSDGEGLSTSDLNKLQQYRQQWDSWLQKHQTAVQTGGMTWADWAYQYRLQSAAYANEVKGVTDNTSDYTQGSEGLLAQYEAIYNNKASFDANGDINWAAVQRQQDALQAKTDPATWRQMMALKDQREMQYPILRVYKDTMRNYHNWQDTEAKKLGVDPETLRAQIAGGAEAPNFAVYEAAHPELARYYADKRVWEMTTKQGFAYGLFTNNSYVMRIVAPHGTAQEAGQAEAQILKQAEGMEQGGTFVTPSGE